MSARDTKVAWAAGFFDGEGSINIGHQSNKRYHKLVVEVSQKERDPIDAFHLIFGGEGTIHRKIHSAGGTARSSRPYFTLVMNGAGAARVLEEMLPHLVAKKYQARIALSFQKTMKPTRGKRGAKNLTEETIAVRELCRDALHASRSRTA